MVIVRLSGHPLIRDSLNYSLQSLITSATTVVMPPSVPHSNLVHDTSTQMLALPHVSEVRKKEQRIMRYIQCIYQYYYSRRRSANHGSPVNQQAIGHRKQCGDIAIKNNVLHSSLQHVQYYPSSSSSQFIAIILSPFLCFQYPANQRGPQTGFGPIIFYKCVMSKI